MWPADERLLGLLAEHEVLTTGQLARLTGMCERTVQHRLALLTRRGLTGRLRPTVLRGTSPYLCWATRFGGHAIGAEPASRDRSTARVSAVAVLNELWLALRDIDTGTPVRLVDWQRTLTGVPVGGARRLAVDAQFTVDTRGDEDQAQTDGLVLLDTGQLPTAGLTGPLRSFAQLVASAACLTEEAAPWLLIVTRSLGRVPAWLSAADMLSAHPPAGLGAVAARLAADRVAVCVCSTPSGPPILDRPWHRRAGACPLTLPELLAGAGEGRQRSGGTR